MLKRLFKSEPPKEPVKQTLNIPKGWFIYCAGQNPVHMLWFINLIHFETNKIVSTEEQDTLFDAINYCVKEAKEKYPELFNGEDD